MTDNWVADLERALAALAAEGRCATYNELAGLCRMPPPHRIHKLTLALEDLIRADHEAGRPLRAALAISRGPDRIPGRGFFQLLNELGRYAGPDRGPEAVRHHAELIAALYGPDPSG